MKIGVSTATFFGRMYTEEALELIASNNVPVCEVFLATLSEYTDSFCNDKLLKVKGNVEVHSVHAMTTQYEPQLFNSYSRTRKDAEDILRQVLSVGKRLGAKFNTFHGPYYVKKIRSPLNYENLSKTFKHITDVTDEYDMSLSYENVHWTYYNTLSYFPQILAAAPKIRTTLDLKQAMLSGISYTCYLDEMKDTLSTVHICDYDANGKLCAPLKGIFDYRSLFARLIDLGFDGALLIELYGNDYGDEKEVFESLEKLNNLYEITKQSLK